MRGGPSSSSSSSWPSRASPVEVYIIADPKGRERRAEKTIGTRERGTLATSRPVAGMGARERARARAGERARELALAGRMARMARRDGAPGRGGRATRCPVAPCGGRPFGPEAIGLAHDRGRRCLLSSLALARAKTDRATPRWRAASKLCVGDAPAAGYMETKSA